MGASQAAFRQFFEREIAILASIRHPNVVNFIGEGQGRTLEGAVLCCVVTHQHSLVRCQCAGLIEL